MRSALRLYNYRNFIQWQVERDILNASFTRMGSGFITPGILKEAQETHERISQILNHYQKILEWKSHPYPHEHVPLQVLEVQKTAPKSSHPEDDGNLL